ncbi:hypothetical protein [Microcystis aeruginosa]|uniref:hypothetical protein n=1 Tax=Microcystis aeruginosa TaxID=1126 RepID=UPI00123112B0|nr:hypothetical protein [Microcystis aeruginosa]
MSIGYISGQAKGNRQEAKGAIDNQFLITRFSITFPFGGASRQDSFVIGKLGYTSPLGKTLSQSIWKMS